VVPLSDVLTTLSTLIWDDTSYVTAVAIVNPSAEDISVDITVLDSAGNLVGNASLPMAAGTKTAVALRNIAGLAGMAGRFGLAQFSVSNGSVAVLGLRFSGIAFTSIPTTDQ
jgi:hypothetical protein